MLPSRFCTSELLDNFSKIYILARSFSINSRAKPLSLFWDMKLRRKFLISLSLEKDLSAVATVIGTVIYGTSYMPYKRQEVVASDAFLTMKKETISLADFKWGIFSLNDVLMESIWLRNNGETLSESLLENFLASISRFR